MHLQSEGQGKEKAEEAWGSGPETSHCRRAITRQSTVIVSGSRHEPSILLNPIQPGQAVTTNFILQGCKKTKEFPQICVSHWGFQNHVCSHVASIPYCFVIATFTLSLLYYGLPTFSPLICVLYNPICDTFYMNTSDFYVFTFFSLNKVYRILTEDIMGITLNLWGK